MYQKFDRVGLLGVLAAVWAFQLIMSPLWLSVFRFGPAEWLWRTLTYFRIQPMLRAQTPERDLAPGSRRAGMDRIPLQGRLVRSEAITGEQHPSTDFPSR